MKNGSCEGLFDICSRMACMASLAFSTPVLIELIPHKPLEAIL